MNKLLLNKIWVAGLSILFMGASYAESVKIGLNYPETGPYAVQGLYQKQAAELAVEEINAQGGIMGKQVELVIKDSKSKADVTEENVRSMIDDSGVKMVFGGSASSVAIAAGRVATESKIPFFGTLTYSNATTGKAGYYYMFRECYNAWAAAKTLADYMNKNFAGKKFFYITADYTWGWTTEASMRADTNTTDANMHKGLKTPFPGATAADFERVIQQAKAEKPDVLVLVLFGSQMAQAVQIAHREGLKADMQIIVPNVTLGMAKSAGPEAMEGVVGALPWTWKLQDKYPGAKKFVQAFEAKYNTYPSTSAASAYTIMYQYKDAVEAAQSFDGDKVVAALEGKKYTLLKDEQEWRAFDHQSVQTVYAVKGKSAAEVKKDKYQLDYFEIIDQLSGEKAFRSKADWSAARKAAGKPDTLEKEVPFDL